MVTITATAAEELKKILEENGKNPETIVLRVFVRGGGCSGFEYGLMIEENGQSDGDTAFESNGIKIVVDPISIRYLKGTEIDFDPTRTGFIFKNPNATSTCGCGSSFNTE